MLQLQHVSITFNEGTPDEKKALKNINLLLDRGEFVTVIGGNGAGKSTLMNIISGSLFSDIGRVVINGQDVGIYQNTNALVILDVYFKIRWRERHQI